MWSRPQACCVQTVEDFRNLSLEFIGDTGAAHDIGSFKALAEQGFEREILEPWLKMFG